MSFEELQSRNQVVNEGSRVILRLSGIPDGPPLDRQSAFTLLTELHDRGKPLNPAVKFDPGPAHIYIDAAVPTTNQYATLLDAVERIDTALTTTFVPADIREARLGEFVPGLDTSRAWYLMQGDSDTDVTSLAQDILLHHRNDTIRGSFDRIFFET